MLNSATHSLPYFMSNSDSQLHDSENTINVALMLRVKQGDHEAFQQIVERHQHTIVGTVAKMMGNASDSQDIAQKVFLGLWKSSKRYKPKAKFTTYLLTITKHHVFNECKKRARRKTHSLEEQEETYFQQIADSPTKSPSAEALQSELQNAVDTAINLLPEKQRMAIILRRYENMPYTQIADILKMSVSALKSQLFRARNTLRESLQPYLEE